MFRKRATQLLICLVVGASCLFGQTTPKINAVTNVASYATGSISPGEMVAIWGTGMGPTTLVGGQLDSSGNLATTVAGVRVHFSSGQDAPLVYVSSTLIAAMVPYEVGGFQSIAVDVFYQNVPSSLFGITVASTAPGVFSANATGTGQAAMTNSDGSLNSATHPATPGTFVTFYVTGAGQTNPAGVDGAIAKTIANLSLPLTVTIGGLPAQVLYAGAAPQEVNGFIQVNAVVPAGVPGGNLPLSVQVGGATSQAGICGCPVC
jgi:uncharacterized protein (TIGR03437 family)